MRGLFWALVLRPILRDRLRSAVTIVAVALGVAIAVAIDLANATAVASFASSVNVISNHVNLQVLGLANGFDERAILRVQELPGVTYASPAIEDAIVTGARRGEPSSGEILRVLGVDLMRPLPGSVATTAGVPGNLTSDGAPDPYDLIDRHGAFISRRIADHYRLHVGSTLRGLAGDRPVTLLVSGILERAVPGLDSSVVFVDIATAQELFGKLGRLDRIDCIVDPARLQAVKREIARVIPAGTRAVEPHVRTSEIRRMLRSFELNLAALSYIALLVGMYLIYNTVAISVVQGRAEIGTVRALGATRGATFRTFVGEGILFGIAGSILGLLLGAFLARYSVAAVSRTVDTLYVASHADRILYDPLVFARAFALGCAFAIVSAIVPAIEASRTAPALAMREGGFERRSPRLPLVLAAAGFAVLVVAVLLTRVPAIDGIPLAGYAAGLCIIFGISLCTPLIVAIASRIGVRLLAGRWAPGELAAANLAAALVRTSVAVASLTIAIGMMISIAVLVGSFRTTVVAWADETLRADLFVKPLGLQDASYDARFSANVPERIARIPGVAGMQTFRAISIPYGGGITTLGASDMASTAVRRNLRLLGGNDPGALFASLIGTDRTLASEPFATRYGLGAGDRVTIPTPSGPTTLTIAGVYNDYSSDAGVLLVDRRTYERLFHDSTVNSVAVFVRPGEDPVAVRSRIIRALAPLQVDAQTTRELRAIVLQIFDRTFAITYALYVISIAIAVLGIVTTLFALVLERRREIGVLRYLGLRIRDVRAMVFAEAGLVGAIGGVCGILTGLLLSLVLIFVINRQAFGWLIELHVPYAFIAQAFVTVIAVAIAAGFFPANLAARIRTAEAVRTE